MGIYVCLIFFIFIAVFSIIVLKAVAAFKHCEEQPPSRPLKAYKYLSHTQ